MITQQQCESVVERCAQMLQRAGIVVTPEERARIEVADFGLGEVERTGVEILVYVNTERVCAKELVLLPQQTCPEHWHPTVGGRLGKEETFRCRWGIVYLYVPGPRAGQPACHPPQGAIISEFSTRSTDEQDIFTDPRIKRMPEISKA